MQAASSNIALPSPQKGGICDGGQEVGILRLDAESGRIRGVNSSLRELLGFAEEEVLGRTRAEILGKNESELLFSGVAAAQALTTTTPGAAGRSRAGEEGREGAGSADERRAGGISTGVILCSHRCQTSRRAGRGRNNLRKASESVEKASQAKSDFLANMSHEVLTPMNGLIETLNLLKEDETSPERLHVLEIAKGSAVSLLKLLTEILTLSSPKSSKTRRPEIAFVLNHGLDLNLQPLRREAVAKGMVLNSRLAAEIPEILRGDPCRLGLIVTNLVTNAIKFTESGQKDLEVSVEARPAREITLLFVVRDMGIGISLENQEAISSPSVQVDSSGARPYDGFGLGLTIMQRIVKIMGGRVWVEGELGKGSAFFLLSPSA